MAQLFKFTTWMGDKSFVKAETMTEAFEIKYDGPITETGYNQNGVWMAIDDETGIGYVMNDSGDACATVTVTNFL